MRGGIQYNDVMNLSSTERNLIVKLANDNIETTQKSGLPFFQKNSKPDLLNFHKYNYE